ncbi:MAG: Flp pilus assembly complex ATPase component TadA [Phycisphaerales bacterium]|nr:Flp pilus assembly complex ATPase component TadA [Phycisphaerales bacterium]
MPYLILSDSSVFLLSPWKPLLIWGVFLAWAWLVSTKLDKDCRYLNLNWRMWNSLHLGAGSVALIVMFTAGPFLLSWPLGILIMIGPVLAYWKARNAHVPEERRYYLSFSKDPEAARQKKMAKARLAAVIHFANSQGQDIPIPQKDEDAYPVYLQVEDIIGPALESRASVVELMLSSKGAVVASTIDGVRSKQAELDAEEGSLVLSYFKQLGGLDIENTRRRQMGTFSLTTPSTEADVHITSSGSSKGQQIKLEFNRESSRSINYDLLGLLPQQRAGLDELDEAHERHGLVLITAPSGQGLTSTAYAMLGRHDAYTCNIKSIEHDIETWVNGVDQVQWDPTNPDVDFATNLQSILRRDPDICLAMDATDSETARVAIAPGLSGPLIYYTFPCDSITNAIREWVKQVGDVEEAVKPLRAILNQRLVRKLCQNCRQPMTDEEQSTLKLPSGIPTNIHRPVGKVQVKNKVEDCPVCNGTGYLGQTAVFEVLIVDKEIRTHLRSGDLKSALAQARRNRMLHLQEAALWKAGSGEISLEEITRVLQPKKSSGAKKKSNKEVKSS